MEQAQINQANQIDSADQANQAKQAYPASQTYQAEQAEQTEQAQRVQEILNFLVKKGFLLDKELLDFFGRLDDKELSEDILNKIATISHTRIITKAMIAVHFNEIKSLLFETGKEKKEIIETLFKSIPSEAMGLSALEKQKEKAEAETRQKIKQLTHPKLKILSSNIIPYRKITMKDFITHFKNRYNFIKDILKNNAALTNLVSINKLGRNSESSVIGLVYSKRVTKNKNVIIELEDPTGRVSVLINQNKQELFEKAKEILLDDIIGVRCAGSRDILFVNDIFFPDSSVTEKKRAEEEVYALFIADAHVGSKNFLEKNFARFIDWLNGVGCDEEQKKRVEKIRYLFIAGDNVDGVGIFPEQEDRLAIKDIKEQYKVLASYLARVPKHITMIMCPGQHDAVRVPEPQPPVDEEFGGPITRIPNLFLVSNPALVEIESGGLKRGFKVLMYHGASMHSWIDEIEELRLGKAALNPAKVVKYFLRHRHLSPTHSATTYVPNEEEDSTMIKEIPDIVATGDMHRSDIDMYNNILIICSSCWQSITPFEEKVGNVPDPCKVPILNLKTRELKILDFSDTLADEDAKTEKEEKDKESAKAESAKEEEEKQNG